MLQHNQPEQIRACYRALGGVPEATADLRGSEEYPAIKGTALFYQTTDGVLVSVFASGLPVGKTLCEAPVFALHIHSGGACAGDPADPFGAAQTHYNPDRCPHPYHVGDTKGPSPCALLYFFCNCDNLEVLEQICILVIGFTQPNDGMRHPTEAEAFQSCRRDEHCSSGPPQADNLPKANPTRLS